MRRIPPLAAALATAPLLLMLAGCQSSGRAAEFEEAAAQRSRLTGKPAIDFTLPNQDGKPVRLSDQLGHWVVLYFYPADGTPGCTCQAREFTRTHAGFQKLDARVFGISPDTVESHRRFVAEYGLTVDLLADPEHKVLKAYGAFVNNIWGPHVIRSTVLIDPSGKIVYHWPEVVPDGHAERVRSKLAELRAQYASAQ